MIKVVMLEWFWRFFEDAVGEGVVAIENDKLR